MILTLLSNNIKQFLLVLDQYEYYLLHIFQQNTLFVKSNSISFFSAIILTVDKCFTSGSSSMMASVLSTGQEVSFCLRTAGTLNHLEEDLFLFASNLRGT